MIDFRLAMRLLSTSVVPSKTKTIIEYSSGSTVISMSMCARVFHGIDDTKAFLSNKTSEAKLRLMQFFGLNLTLFGGPSQPEPADERGGIQVARAMAAESDDTVNPNQYENDDNWQAHVSWTGPQILKQLPEINVLCAGMGTSGTMTGLGTYFKRSKPSVLMLGVCTAPGDRVPGPRSHALLEPVDFPWREVVDTIEEVGSVESYTSSLQLCREGLVCGPSSGFNLIGLFKMLEKRKTEGTLSDLRSEDGLAHCVFLCCDLPYQYIGEYFQNLGPENFHPIQNEVSRTPAICNYRWLQLTQVLADQRLTKVDLYRYDERWEKDPTEVPEAFHKHLSHSQPASSGCVVLDFRQSEDFATGHIPHAVNYPIRSLRSSRGPSPFADPKVLEEQWSELEALFSQEEHLSKLKSRQVLALCYGGDTSRVATSVLRAKGVEAVSVRGGFQALLDSGTMSFVSDAATSRPWSAWMRQVATRPFSLLS